MLTISSKLKYKNPSGDLDNILKLNFDLNESVLTLNIKNN